MGFVGGLGYGTLLVVIFALLYFRLATIYLIIAINVSRLLYRALQTYK